MHAEKESAALNKAHAELDADRAALSADHAELESGKERQLEEADILQQEATAKEDVDLCKAKFQGLDSQLAELEASKMAMELELKVGIVPSQCCRVSDVKLRHD